MKLKADDLPNKDKKLQWTNLVYINPDDVKSIAKPQTGGSPIDISKLVQIKEFVYKFEENKAVLKGTIGMSNTQRRNTNLAIGDETNVTAFTPPSSDFILGVLKMTIDVIGQKVTDNFDAKAVQDVFRSLYVGQHLSLRQQIIVPFEKCVLMYKVTDVETVDLADLANSAGDIIPTGPRATGGILFDKTIMMISSETLKVVGNREDDSGYVSPFADLPAILENVGGLEKEFCEIYRRAFLLRLFPPTTLKAMGIKPEKGILLYGPPGCGKTLLAREIGKSLTGKEPRIINGPELLNPFVGKAEENVRDLFKAAEEEWGKKGENSSLHVIIFDEIDALCKKRGTRSDNTGTLDSVVNQLLTKIDGPKQLHNILVIGMTNRMDMLDEALIRPGRLGVHVEVGLPDEQGRLRILKVHTRELTENKMLGEDVSLERLAKATKNFTGAEIETLVRNAASFTLNRKVDPETLKPTKSKDPIIVTWSDFAHSLFQIKPKFGIDDTDLKSKRRNGIITFHPHVDSILAEGKLTIEQVSQSEVCPLVNVLISGKPGTGKTALAASIAEESNFPFVQVIDPERLVGFPESMRSNEIINMFINAHRSPLSVILIDEIERLLDYNVIGPRFNNSLVQVFSVMMKKLPPEGHRLLIITTTSIPQIFNDMQLSDIFDVTLRARSLSTQDEFRRVFIQLQTFDNEADADTAAKLLVGNTLPIKKVILMADRMRAAGTTREARLKRLERLAAELNVQ